MARSSLSPATQAGVTSQDVPGAPWSQTAAHRLWTMGQYPGRTSGMVTLATVQEKSECGSPEMLCLLTAGLAGRPNAQGDTSQGHQASGELRESLKRERCGQRVKLHSVFSRAQCGLSGVRQR